MISRVAEHAFWMSRYLERAENTARILDVNQSLLLDFEVPVEHQWTPLLVITGCHLDPHWADPAHQARPDSESVQSYMTWERANTSSIASCITAARENARIIRETTSIEMWERLNYLYLWMSGPTARNLYERSRNEFYKQVKEINQTFHGITDATMSHGEAWQFLQLGKFLERACQTARILDVKYHLLRPGTREGADSPVDAAHWTAVLKSCSGYEPFHKQRRLSVGIEPGRAVAEFLIFDTEFPRSVLKCLSSALTAARAIQASAGHGSTAATNPTRDRVEQALGGLVDHLSGSSIAEFYKTGLHNGLTEIIDTVHDIGTAVQQTYFEMSIRADDPALAQ